MFTGIIESLGTIQGIEHSGSNLSMWIQSSISPELKIDQSVAHNGVCLTVEEVQNGIHRVTAIYETLEKTTLKRYKVGDRVNLERCMSLNDRLDGHIVQGHVDITGVCIKKTDLAGSLQFEIQFPAEFAHLIIDKGSICVDGISLTCFNVKSNEFTIAVIPFTLNNTNLSQLAPGNEVNIEFDVIGKYVSRLMHKQYTR
jgi:riboflavin synthase